MSSYSDLYIQPFLDYLKYQKRYSQHTIISYQTDLVDFMDFLAVQYGNVSLPEIIPAYIRSWLACLKANNISSKSINRKISALKSFFKYQLRNKAISVSPVSNIGSLKMNKRLPVYIEQKDISTLFENVQFPDTWQGKTDRLLLKIFYQTGIRLSELINLKESQIDTAYNNIKVTGKGNKERIIPVSNELAREILLYIEEKKRVIANVESPCVLLSSKGKKLYTKYVYNTVKSYLSDVTTNKKKSPHVLRHSFATHLTNNGADINAVKELLGHASLAATQIYSYNTIEKLKQVHKNAHPKA